MFHVQSNEDLDAVKRYYFQRLPNDRIFGFSVPLSKLATYVPELLQNVPHDVTYMCDLETEVFWWDDMKPSVTKFFSEHPQIHDTVKKGMKTIPAVHKFTEKIEAHRAFWESIIRDRRTLMSLLTSYINRQNAYQINILSAFSPFILDKEHLDFVEESYTLTRRLYHNGTNDIEQVGKLIGLYANFHTDFLAKKPNVSEFFKMIERTLPKALIFKISNLEDIREKPSFKANYDYLLKGIGDLSQTFNIPTFYFSTHTSGYKANTQGIDVFCEPFNQKGNVQRQKKGMDKVTLERTRQNNPTFMSGRIYDIKTGESITRKEFQETRLIDNGIDSPITNLSHTTPASITSMTDRSFREFSKMLLMESRNFEEEELHVAINKGNLHRINNKLTQWEGAGIPK
ncbi:MAG: hypothetical protein HY223_06370 [Thaumarchaeota archaeon]|nr:hypothetical protein [Nitrososphaerota archaeon]